MQSSVCIPHRVHIKILKNVLTSVLLKGYSQTETQEFKTEAAPSLKVSNDTWKYDTVL
jgi:hypothetical protein